MIASGSFPNLKGMFPGSKWCMTSDDIFKMEELPKSMAILGGGYIAVEMAGIMQALGVNVTLIVRSKMLRMVD